MFQRVLKDNNVNLDFCKKNTLTDLEKKYLFKVAGGYETHQKGDFYDKQDYHKVDTPWGGWG